MYKEYDMVLLKDGREGTIMSICGGCGEYSVDVGTTPETWDNIFVTEDQIEKVLTK
jgi:hypothetical protein